MTDGLSWSNSISASPAAMAQNLIHSEGRMTGYDYALQRVLCPTAK